MEPAQITPAAIIRVALSLHTARLTPSNGWQNCRYKI